MLIAFIHNYTVPCIGLCAYNHMCVYAQYLYVNVFKLIFFAQKYYTLMLQFFWFSLLPSLCLGGHILKFPQDQFFMQSRFSSHLKDVVLRMVIRSSLFHLLNRSLLLPAARSRLEAIAEMLEQWRFSRSKQLHVSLGFFVVFFHTDLHPV